MRRPFWNYQDEPALVLVLTGYRWTISQHANTQMEGDSEEGCQAKTDAAAALGVQAQNLQTVLQHNPDMAARTMDGIDVQGFATESARVDFVDQLLAHGATVNAGALLGAVQSLFVDMVRRNRHLTAYFFWSARWRRTASAELPTDDTAERNSSTVQLRLLVQYLTS